MAPPSLASRPSLFSRPPPPPEETSPTSILLHNNRLPLPNHALPNRTPTALLCAPCGHPCAIRDDWEYLREELGAEDITGAVASDAASAAKSKKTGDGKEQAQDKAVQSADVGKIVSLIATDSPQIAQLVTFLTVSLLPTYASRF